MPSCFNLIPIDLCNGDLLLGDPCNRDFPYAALSNEPAAPNALLFQSDPYIDLCNGDLPYGNPCNWDFHHASLSIVIFRLCDASLFSVYVPQACIPSVQNACFSSALRAFNISSGSGFPKHGNLQKTHKCTWTYRFVRFPRVPGSPGVPQVSWGLFPEGSRKFEEVWGSPRKSEKVEKVRERLRKLKKVRGS